MLELLFALVCSAAAQNYELAILLKGASALAFYSAEGKEIARTPVREHPHEMVFSPDRRFLYTTDNGTMRIEQPGSGGNFVSIVDVKARQKTGEIQIGEFRRPHGIDLDPKTGLLYVTTEFPDRLLAINTQTRKIERVWETKGKTAHMVTLGPGAKHAYISHSNSANIAVIDLAGGKVKLLATGARPEGSVLSADGRYVYVVNREAAAVDVIDTGRQEIVARIATGKGPVRIARTPDDRQIIYACMHDEVVEFADTQARKVIGRTGKLPGPLVSLTVSRDGKFAFASAEERDTVYILSIRERKLVKTLQLPKGSHPDPVFAIE
ncbi:MAG: beta-propeller fold lactonase family protein [Acidobacteria bacterium]|nr:beta-propeller fold lactonase family protein [Acidobacteriota bacterium]